METDEGHIYEIEIMEVDSGYILTWWQSGDKDVKKLMDHFDSLKETLDAIPRITGWSD